MTQFDGQVLCRSALEVAMMYLPKCLNFEGAHQKTDSLPIPRIRCYCCRRAGCAMRGISSSLALRLSCGALEKTRSDWKKVKIASEQMYLETYRNIVCICALCICTYLDWLTYTCMFQIRNMCKNWCIEMWIYAVSRGTDSRGTTAIPLCLAKGWASRSLGEGLGWFVGGERSWVKQCSCLPP